MPGQGISLWIRGQFGWYLGAVSILLLPVALLVRGSDAPQVLIIDGRILATGSYNLSDNAEHNTMENMVILDGGAYPDLVNAYVANFEAIWTTGESEQVYDHLVEQIENADDGFPIVFEPMALDWQQVTDLKALIRDRCPQINSAEYRNAPQSHRWCSLSD